jgi:uncharacterized protein (TIGR00288 family)
VTNSCRLFHDDLVYSGFRLDLVPSIGKKQEGVDVRMALIAQWHAMQGDVDAVVLITGDSDFRVLAQELQFMGVDVEVFSFERSLSHALEEQADSVTILDDLPIIRMDPKRMEVA